MYRFKAVSSDQLISRYWEYVFAINSHFWSSRFNPFSDNRKSYTIQCIQELIYRFYSYLFNIQDCWRHTACYRSGLKNVLIHFHWRQWESRSFISDIFFLEGLLISLKQDFHSIFFSMLKRKQSKKCRNDKYIDLSYYQTSREDKN